MIFGITMGDSSGIGPEIVLHAHSAGKLQPHRCVVYGDLAVLSRCNDLLGYGVKLKRIEGPEEYEEGPLNVVDLAQLNAEDITPGKLNAKSGAAAHAYVTAATKAALDNSIAAMVTLPMNKEATQLSYPNFVGHTELIGAICGVKDVTIMLVSHDLIVTHVSTHVSLAQAIQLARKERICRIIELTYEAVGKLRGKARIAVAGLNPHAGEGGLFGCEEIEEITPAVQWAKGQGMNVEGPLPPDTVFYLAKNKQRYDAIVCMYHDQGHIPLKLLDFDGGVNVALGIPIIRTSVDHGTAFDIAWQSRASTSSFESALALAVRMAGA